MNSEVAEEKWILNRNKQIFRVKRQSINCGNDLQRPADTLLLSVQEWNLEGKKNPKKPFMPKGN